MIVSWEQGESGNIFASILGFVHVSSILSCYMLVVAHLVKKASDSGLTSRDSPDKPMSWARAPALYRYEFIYFIGSRPPALFACHTLSRLSVIRHLSHFLRRVLGVADYCHHWLARLSVTGVLSSDWFPPGCRFPTGRTCLTLRGSATGPASSIQSKEGRRNYSIRMCHFQYAAKPRCYVTSWDYLTGFALDGK